jgi:hypothetical protein
MQEVVMPGLVPGIHVLGTARQGVDGRDKPGHDNVEPQLSQAPASGAIALRQARAAVPLSADEFSSAGWDRKAFSSSGENI